MQKIFQGLTECSSDVWYYGLWKMQLFKWFCFSKWNKFEFYFWKVNLLEFHVLSCLKVLNVGYLRYFWRFWELICDFYLFNVRAVKKRNLSKILVIKDLINQQSLMLIFRKALYLSEAVWCKLDHLKVRGYKIWQVIFPRCL